MNWKILQIKEQIFHSPSHPYFFSQQYPSPPRAPPNIESSGFSLNDEVSPSVLLIIIILAIIFFVSGLLHLLVRVLMRPSYRDPDDLENVTSLQGQLQQLFHLHDAGVDQSFIDTLPVFNYNAIIGCKNPLDCAVCLCEFEQEDKLRLLPKCSHAFHMACIDTWLLSHSTCPICRASLLPENNNCSPIVFVLESESESSREFVSNRETSHGNLTNSSAARTNSHLDFQGENELGSVPVNIPPKSCEIHVKSDGSSSHEVNEKVVSIKLEKFRSVDGGEYKETGLGILTNSSASRTNSHLGFRGDGEMGSIPINVSHKSCEVVVKADYSSSREVNERVVSIKLGKFRSVGEGESSSESNAVSRRCFSMGSFAYVMEENPSLQVPIKTGLDVNGGCISNRLNGRSVERSRRESFSVSKIWMRSKMENPNPTADSSRRAFSFRFRAPAANDEIQRSDLQGKVPSFARTLRWLVGRQSKAVHSTSALNI